MFIKITYKLQIQKEKCKENTGGNTHGVNSEELQTELQNLNKALETLKSLKSAATNNRQEISYLDNVSFL